MFDRKPQNIAIICGAIESNLVALDCDTPKTFIETKTQLGEAGIQTWIVKRNKNGTTHDGGGSFILRTPTPVASKKHGDIDIIGAGGYFMAPPSAHPGGGLYYSNNEPIARLPDLDALGWLNLKPAQTDRPKQQKLSGKAWRLLNGDAKTIGAYQSRSEAEIALCESLARAGRNFNEVLRLFRAYPGPGKFREKDMDPLEGRRYLYMTWCNGLDWINTTENKATILAKQLKSWALGHAWRGRGASSDRAVYLAHCNIVLRCGKQPHGAGLRELGEMAGVHWATAGRATTRLIKAGLLELITESTPSLPNIYALTVPSEQEEKIRAYCYTPSHGGVMECSSMHTISHDIFRWAGLNKSGAEVWQALQGSELTIRELAAMTGRHRTTVKRKLLTMVDLGLVENVGDDWCIVDGADLSAAAGRLGTKGAGQAQRIKHIRDRRLHRRVLDRGRYY